MSCEVRIDDPDAEVSVEFGVLDELDCEMRIGDLTISARWRIFDAIYRELGAYFVPDAGAGGADASDNGESNA